MENYPPLPYPRKPRYRVQEYLGTPWREVSDAELLADGDNPADYMPATVKLMKPKLPGFFARMAARGYSARELCADVVSGVIWGCVFWALMRYQAHKSTALEIFGVVFIASFAERMVRRLALWLLGPKETPPAPAAPAPH